MVPREYLARDTLWCSVGTSVAATSTSQIRILSKKSRITPGFRMTCGFAENHYARLHRAVGCQFVTDSESPKTSRVRTYETCGWVKTRENALRLQRGSREGEHED